MQISVTATKRCSLLSPLHIQLVSFSSWAMLFDVPKQNWTLFGHLSTVTLFKSCLFSFCVGHGSLVSSQRSLGGTRNNDPWPQRQMIEVVGRLSDVKKNLDQPALFTQLTDWRQRLQMEEKWAEKKEAESTGSTGTGRNVNSLKNSRAT